MNIKDFDTLNASLTLRNLSKEEKQAVVRLMELSIEEKAKEYTSKCLSFQHKMHQTAFGLGVLMFFVGYLAGWLIFAFKFGGW